MKFYLLKQEGDYNKELCKFTMNPVTEEDFNLGVISRSFKIFDENNNKHYYCFLYTPEPKLVYLRKELSDTFFSEDKMEDYCEVTYEQMMKFLNQYGNEYKHIIKKIETLLLKQKH